MALHPHWPLSRLPQPAGVAVHGHVGQVTAARFSLDGGYLVTGDQSGRVLVSDTRTGEMRQTFRWSTPPMSYGTGVTTLAVGPRDQIAIGLVDGSVRVIGLGAEANGQRTVVASNPAGAVDTLGFFADGNRLLSRDQDGIRVHDLDGGRILCNVRPEHGWQRLPWRVLGNLLAVGDGTSVVTWPIDDPGGKRELRGHAAPVIALDVLPGLLVSTDEIGVVRTWDAATGRCLAAFVGAGAPAVDARNGRIVVPSASGAARIVDPRAGDSGQEISRHTRRALRRERAANRLAAVADRFPRWADGLYGRADRMSGGLDGVACLAGPGLTWMVVVRPDEEVDGDLISLSHVLTFLRPDGSAADTIRLAGRCVLVTALSLPGRFATVSDQGVVRVWEATGTAASILDVTEADVTVAVHQQTGAAIAVGDRGGGLRIVDPSLPAPSDDRDATEEARCTTAEDLVVDPDGSWAATTTPDRSVMVWDLPDGTVRRVFPGHTTGLFRTSRCPNRVVGGSDGRRQWLAYTDDDGTLRVRDPLGGGRISLVSGAEGELAGISGPGWVAVAERDGRLLLRDAWTGAVMRELTGHADRVRSTAVDRAGTLLVTSAVDGVRVWDVATARTQLILPAERGGLGDVRVAMDPGGRWLAVVGEARVRVHDLQGRLVDDLTLPCRASVVTAGLDGMLLLGREDGALMVGTPGFIEMTTMTCAGEGALTACAAAPDGRLAATGDDRGVARVWDLRDREAVAEIAIGGAIVRCAWVSGRLMTAGRSGVNLLNINGRFPA